jgi:PAS domain S-box-containing protein
MKTQSSKSTLKSKKTSSGGKASFSHDKAIAESKQKSGRETRPLTHPTKTLSEDITKRKQLEEELKLSEEKFSKAFYASPNLMAITRPEDGIIIEINESFCRFLGYQPEECVGHTTAELRMWTDPEQRKSILRKLDETGSAMYMNVDLQTKSGEIRSVIDSFTFLTIKNQRYLLSVATDITEHKRAEEALQKSAEEYQYIINTSLDGFSRLDQAGRFIDVNNSYCQMLGYSRGELLNMNIRDVEAIQSEAKTARRMKRIVENGNDLFEVHLRCKDSRIVDVEVNVVYQPLEKQFISFSHDITSRKQTEQSLRESEQRFRTFVEQSVDGAVLIDEQEKIIEWNPAQEKITGISRAEAVGTSFAEMQFQLLPPEHRANRSIEFFKEAMQDAFQKGELLQFSQPVEVEIQTASGERKVIMQNAFPIKAERGFRIGSIVHDMTARRKVEEELARRSEELARLYRASGSLLAESPFDLPGLAQAVLKTVLDEFGQSNCSLLMVDEDYKKLIRIAAMGPYSDQVSKVELTLDGPGLVPEAIRTAQCINTPDVRANPSYIPGWEIAKSELTIPLKIGSRVIGVIDVQSAQPNAFSASDERLMTIFAERAALVLAHARLYAQTERRMQNLTALRTIDMAISSSFDMHLTLNVLLDQVIKQLDIHAADILIFNPFTRTLQFSIGQGFRTQALQHTNLRLGEGYAGRAVLERRIVVIQNLSQAMGELSRSDEFSQEGFITYIGIPLTSKGSVKGVLEVFQREPLEMDSERRAFLEILGGQAAIAIDIAQLFDNLQSSNAELLMAYDETIEGWSQAMDFRDKETEGHSRRVTEMTVKLAGDFGIPPDKLRYVRWGALLHDIGKLAIPDEILHKPGALTGEEWVIMRKHPQFAYDLLAPITYLRSSLDIPYCHHEKWDGTGYPSGLKENQIPLTARIFAVVDVWDALTSDRPYRKAWPKEKVLEYIQEQSGKHFDPMAVGLFLREVANFK